MKFSRRGLPLTLCLVVLMWSVTSMSLAQGPLDSPLRSYADVAAKTMPSVVNISTDKVIENNNANPFFDDPMFRRFFNMPNDDTHGRGGDKQVQHSLGSGVVISTDGYILTNNHVVENADKIVVNFNGEREYEAEVIGTDPPTDVALIKIDAENLPAISIGDSEALRVGDQVMAIGNPFGVGQTVTMGIVGGLGRNIGLMQYSNLIQTDASINPGNSGGALVNMEGELVGMNAAILSRSGGSQGIGFAIPTKMAMRVIDALRDGGRVQRAYLGVLPQPVNQAVADYYKMDRPEGVLIAQVNEDTPAQKAGLKDGDIILAVDGKPIKNPSMLRNTISLSDVGHDAKLDILREGKHKTVKVTLDAFPDAELAQAKGNNAGEESDETLDGVTVKALSPRIRAMANLPDDIEGLYVMDLDPTSNAAREGLQQGDVIQEVNREAVSSLKDFKDALGHGTDRPVFMRVYKPQAGGQGRSIFIAVPR